MIITTLAVFDSCDNAIYLIDTEPARAMRQSNRVDVGSILFVSTSKFEHGFNKRYKLYSMNEDGSNVRLFPYDTSVNIYNAQWSPNGRKIAATTDDGIVIMNYDGSGSYVIAKEGLLEGNYYYPGGGPVWSPDGKKIVYSRLMAPEALGISHSFVINIDGTNEIRIGQEDFSPGISSWTTNGIFVGSEYFFAQDSNGSLLANNKLVFLNVQGNLLRTWGEVGQSNFGPVVSSQDGRIAFVSSKDCRCQHIRLMNFDGTNDYEPFRLSRSTVKKLVAWSPDGKKLLVQDGNESVASKMLIVTLATKEIKEIMPFNKDSVYSQAVSWRK